RAAKPLRMLGTEDVRVCVVVYQREVRPAPEVDGERRVESAPDNGAQRGRPLVDGPECDRRPVDLARKLPHLAIAQKRVADPGGNAAHHVLRPSLSAG